MERCPSGSPDQGVLSCFSSLTCVAYSKEREDANLPEEWSQHIPGFAEVLSVSS